MNASVLPSESSARPLVTVVTATFNLVQAGRVESLRRCLESVQEQTYGQVEHVVIDGASTDGTLELLQEYEARGWIRVYSEPDRGIYDAFNKGIMRANGRYCAFMNSDDFWHDARGVEVSVHALELFEGDFSYAPATYLRPDGAFDDACEPEMAAFFCMIPCNHQTMLYRTEVLREFMYDAEHFRMLADFELTTRLLLAGRRGVYVPLNFTSFRLGGFSEDKGLEREECLQVFRRHYGPLIGEEAAEELYTRVIPRGLLRCLASRVQADIMAQAWRLFVPLPHDARGRLMYCPEKPYTRRRWRGLFGLTWLKARVAPGRVTYRSVCSLPVLTKRYSVELRGAGESVAVCRTWLFGFVPLWRSCRCADVWCTHDLFQCLPVWSWSRSGRPAPPPAR